MVLWDTSPPSSWSAGFLNKVTIPCSNTSSLNLLACRVTSSMNFDSVTPWDITQNTDTSTGIDNQLSAEVLGGQGKKLVLYVVERPGCTYQFLAQIFCFLPTYMMVGRGKICFHAFHILWNLRHVGGLPQNIILPRNFSTPHNFSVSLFPQSLMWFLERTHIGNEALANHYLSIWGPDVSTLEPQHKLARTNPCSKVLGRYVG